MKKVLYAWELGANLGHIGTFLPVARALPGAGIAPVAAVRNIFGSGDTLARAGITCFQAPFYPDTVRPPGQPPLNYADILLDYGYADRAHLLGLIEGWRNLIRTVGPSVILADHAPTAILAARTLDVPVMMFAGGFFMPPEATPTPSMRPWAKIPVDRLQEIDARALAAINEVLARHGRAPLNAVHELFQVAERRLLTFGELDHYRQRTGGGYWGAVSDAGIGVPPAWPAVPGQRIFAYLRPGLPHVDTALNLLRNLGLPTVIYAPGLTAEAKAKLAAPHLVFSDQPADLTRTAAEAALAITYAGAASTLAFLRAGKPVLLLPSHLEQFLFAGRVEQLGAGLMTHPEQPANDLPVKVQRLLHDPAFAARARAFAQRCADRPQDRVVADIVSRCAELCGIAAPPRPEIAAVQ